MHVRSILFLSATLAAATAAGAGSIVVADPSASQPSVMQAPMRQAGGSIVAPTATTVAPSVVILPDAPPAGAPSIIKLGAPSAAGPSSGTSGPQIIKVVRGGQAGGPNPPAGQEAPPALTQPDIPLLDPNDRGTPAKRNALKKQAERLEREAAAAAQQDAAPPPAQ